MATMTHTAARRKDWHAGKKAPGERRVTWFHRVLVKSLNFRGAYTPPHLRYTSRYARLKNLK